MEVVMAQKARPETTVIFLCAICCALVVSASAWARGPQVVPRDSGRAADMGDHYGQALLVHQAVIRGDLPGVRVPARTLAAAPLPHGLPDAAAVHVRRLQAAAQRAATAPDIPAAAAVTATLLATCGLCHDAMGTRPAAAEPAPARVGGAVGHMVEHQRDLDLMMQGLVLPSTSAWQQGVRGLEQAPLSRSDMPPDRSLTSSVRKAEARVHALAIDARSAESTSSRATIYGRLLETCANCHRAHRQIWGPGLP
jgi:hypothetical protein